MEQKRTYNILLVGRTGNGKTSTRNSILDRKIPEVRDSSNRVVFTLESTTSDIIVNVIEGPGIGDTGEYMNGSMESQIELVKEGLKLCGWNVHGIVIVLKYGILFTKQEKEAVNTIQSIFGVDALKRCGVILMTYGDNFEMDTDDEDGMTFEQWCKEQSGDIQQLFEDFSWRCVLFNNRAKDKSEQRALQREQLLKIIDSIDAPYGVENFTSAEARRKMLVLLAQRVELEKETDIFLKQVNDKLDKLDSSPNLDVSDVEREETNVKEYLKYLNVKDNGTGVLHSITDRVKISQIRTQTLKRKAKPKIRPENIPTPKVEKKEPPNKRLDSDNSSWKSEVFRYSPPLVGGGIGGAAYCAVGAGIGGFVGGALGGLFTGDYVDAIVNGIGAGIGGGVGGRFGSCIGGRFGSCIGGRSGVRLGGCISGAVGALIGLNIASTAINYFGKRNKGSK